MTDNKQQIEQNFFNPTQENLITIDTNQNYIGDYIYELLDILKSNDVNKILLTSEPNTGKTKSMLGMFSNAFKESSMLSQIAFIYPNVSNVRQIEKEYSDLNIQCLYHKSKKFNKDNGIVISTWDSMKQIPSDHKFVFIIRDEIHKLYDSASYRTDSIKYMESIVNKNKVKIIDITATPTNFTKYDKVIKFNTNIKNENHNIKVNLINKSYSNRIYYDIIESIKNNKDCKHIILQQNMVKNEQLYHTVRDNIDGIKITHINSINKDKNKTYINLIENNILDDIDVLITTDIISNGVNIENNTKTIYHIINYKNVKNIYQLSNRSRNDDNTIINIYSNFDTNVKFNSFNYIYDNIIESVTKVFGIINNMRDITDTYKFGLSDKIYMNLLKSLNDNYNIDEDLEIDYFTIYEIAMNEYYGQMNIDDYKVSLTEYFNEIDIINNEIETEVNVNKKSIIKESKNQVVIDVYNGVVDKSINSLNVYSKGKIKDYNNNKKILPMLNNKQHSMFLVSDKITDIILAKAEIEIYKKKNVIVNKDNKFIVSFIYNQFKSKKKYSSDDITNLYNKFTEGNTEDTFIVSRKKFDNLINIYCNKILINPNQYIIKLKSLQDITDIINKNKLIKDNNIKINLTLIKNINKILYDFKTKK